MGRKNKIKKFTDLHHFSNVIESPVNVTFDQWDASDAGVDIKGHWNDAFFTQDQPITLELACGKGEYTIGLAERFPDRNFIGVDIKGNRIWHGAKAGLSKNLANAGFLRTRIELLPLFFVPGEVHEIWITFPDPFLRHSKSSRRLTSAPFMERFAHVLQPGSTIHLKTDDQTLYDFTLLEWSRLDRYQLLTHNSDIYAQDLEHEALIIKTFYEKQHLENGLTIKHVVVKFLG